MKDYRLHSCLGCKHSEVKEKTFSTSTNNLSGEKTEYCPCCGKRFSSASPAFNQAIEKKKMGKVKFKKYDIVRLKKHFGFPRKHIVIETNIKTGIVSLSPMDGGFVYSAHEDNLDIWIPGGGLPSDKQRTWS